MKNTNEMKHTVSNWFLVANTPGVDIRHRFDGQELTLVENVNYQIANKIIRAVNSHEALIKACRYLLTDLEYRKVETTAAMEFARRTVAQAEEK